MAVAASSSSRSLRRYSSGYSVGQLDSFDALVDDEQPAEVDLIPLPPEKAEQRC